MEKMFWEKGKLEGVGDGFICKRCCEARNNLQTVQVVNGKSSRNGYGRELETEGGKEFLLSRGCAGFSGWYRGGTYC